MGLDLSAVGTRTSGQAARRVPTTTENKNTTLNDCINKYIQEWIEQSVYISKQVNANNIDLQ